MALQVQNQTPVASLFASVGISERKTSHGSTYYVELGLHPKYMREEKSAYLFGLRKIQAGMRRVPLLAMLQAIEDDPLDW